MAAHNENSKKSANRRNTAAKTGMRTSAGRTAAGKTAEGKAALNKTANGRTSSNRTASNKTAAKTTANRRTASTRTAEVRTAAQKTSANKTSTQRTSQKSANTARISPKTSRTKTADKTAAGRTTAGRTTASRTTASSYAKKIRRTAQNRPTHSNAAYANASRSAAYSSAYISENPDAYSNAYSNAGGQKPKKKHPILRFCFRSILILFTLFCAFFAYLWATTEIPQPDAIAVAEKTTVFYSDGVTKIGEFAMQNRTIADCSAMPSHVGNAIVASEDRTFWSNDGVDLQGIARALYNNIRHGTRQGGSTLTQQYAERYYLGETDSYFGKMREAVLAMKIAQSQDKSTVLCNYMNTIYFGRGAYGIQAAAQTYFAKDAQNLTLEESAMIAGIIPAPTAWNPIDNPEAAKTRYERVIGIMNEDGYITEEQKAAAIANTAQPVGSDNPDSAYSGEDSGGSGYILREVQKELTASGKFTNEQLYSGGYRIVTSIDKAKQDAIQNLSASKTAYSEPEGLQSGAMTVRSADGAIEAMYAGDDYSARQLNNATEASYEPGSTMKPFGLLGAIQNKVNLNTTFNGNSPRMFAGLSQPMKNYADKSYGRIDLYKATALSVNTVFMEVNERLTPQVTAKIAKAAGIDSEISPDSPYNILGNDAVCVKDIAQAYSAFSNGGRRVKAHFVQSVSKQQPSKQQPSLNSSASKNQPNSGQEQVYVFDDNAQSGKTDSRGTDEKTGEKIGEQVFNSYDIAVLNKAMTGPVSSGGSAAALAGLGRNLCGKTGTANDGTALSLAVYTPSEVTVMAIWNSGSDGSAQTVPTFSGFEQGEGYIPALVKNYLSEILKNKTNETFPAAADTGLIGGSDGLWGRQ